MWIHNVSDLGQCLDKLSKYQISGTVINGAAIKTLIKRINLLIKQLINITL